MKTHTWVVLAAAAIFFVAAELAHARTWRVRKDGTGDFTAIQPAINAASAGDTIEIGPGRYTENAPFSPFGNWSEPTYVAVTKDNLTIRGTERDAAIIGPPVKNVVGFGPMGIVTGGAVSTIRVENLTVENLYDGMYLIGNATVEGCLSRSCSAGIAAFTEVGLVVRNCVFELNGDGVWSYQVPTMLVQACTFVNSHEGISIVRTTNAVVSSCQFSDGTVGLEYERSNGTVTGCSFANVFSTAVVSNDRSVVTVVGNVITNGQAGVIATLGGHITGSQNLIQGTTYAAALLDSRGTMDFHNNDLLPASGYGARVENFVDPGPYQLDLTNNYWGVETEAEVAALIWDGADDPTIPVLIQYAPFSVRSVPTTESSFGGLKARFGGQVQ